MELTLHEVVKIQLLGMHKGREPAAPLFQLRVKRQGPGPGGDVAQQLVTACRFGGIGTGFGGGLAVEQPESDLSQLLFGIVGPLAAREDLGHPFAVPKLDVGDVHGRQLARSGSHFQHQAIEEAFLELEHGPVIGGTAIQVGDFFFDVEHFGDETVDVPGHVDEQLRIFLANPLGEQVATALVTLGKRGVKPRSSSRNTWKRVISRRTRLRSA